MGFAILPSLLSDSSLSKETASTMLHLMMTAFIVFQGDLFQVQNKKVDLNEDIIYYQWTSLDPETVDVVKNF